MFKIVLNSHSIDSIREIVAAGGLGLDPATSEIYSLDGDSTWRPGPDLPIGGDLSGAASVQLEDTFMIVSGVSTAGASGSIFWFDPDEEVWVEASQVVTNPRWQFAAFLAPPGYVDCS